MINLYWKNDIFLLYCALTKIKEHNEIKRERETKKSVPQYCLWGLGLSTFMEITLRQLPFLNPHQGKATQCRVIKSLLILKHFGTKINHH